MPIWKRSKTMFAAGLAVLLLYYSTCYRIENIVILNHFPASSWWYFNDQACYHRDVMAWSARNLAPSLHYYFPGYALSALPFAALTPSNPFLVPDALSFAATILLLAFWTRRVLPHRQWIFGFVPWVMLLVWVIRPESLRVWIDPWDTSPTVPLGLWCLLAALRFSEIPSAPRAFLAGLSAGLIADFRPIDAVIYAMPAFICAALALPKCPRRRAYTFALAAFAGAAAGLAPGIVAYLLTQGFHKSAYWTLSSQIGFDWHLIAWRWVAIMLSSKVLNGVPGLIPHYPWIVTGLAGVLAGLFRPISRQAASACALLGTATLLEILVYLSYRDLQPTGLFANGNQHYFQLAVAVLAVTSLVVLDSLFGTRASRLAAAAALCLVFLILPWRLTLIRDKDVTLTPTPTGLFLETGLPGRSAVLFVNPCPVHEYADIRSITLTVAGRTYHQIYDFKELPIGNGFLLLPTRRIPAGPSKLTAACGPAPTPLFTASYVETMHITPAL